MNKAALKSYAPAARLEFIQAVTDRAKALGLSAKAIEPVEVKGDVAIIAGQAFPKAVAERRAELERQIRIKGFEQLMEEVAYAWFNRFCALRFMEAHDYLDHGYRVLSNPSGSDIPEILEKATSVDLPGLDKGLVADLRLAGNKDAELYRVLLMAQCNALHKVMPMLFEKVGDATELLLPENLLQTNSPVRKLVAAIPEEDWQEIEILGWLYQFYISEKKDQVIGKVVKSEDIPAATQLFTPNWIVKYMVQNTLGRSWMMTYPGSNLKDGMEFYITQAEQTPEVQAQLDAITPKELNPEELTLLDPACGSGHILVEAYDLFKAIYLERGYRPRDIPRLILEKNLYGLDIDDRAVQLARFALLMKARGDDRRILDAESPARLNVLAFQNSKGLDIEQITATLLKERAKSLTGGQQQLSFVPQPPRQLPLTTTEKPEVTPEELYALLHVFEHAKTFGSLLRIHDKLKAALPRLEKLLEKAGRADGMSTMYAEMLMPLVRQAQFLARKYDCVVANPPYMGSKGQNPTLKAYAKDNFPDSKADLFAMFMERGLKLLNQRGLAGLITMQSWMFLSSYESLRAAILSNRTIISMLHLGARGFDSIGGEVVQTTAFIAFATYQNAFRGSYLRLVDGKSEAEKITEFHTNSALRYTASAADFTKIPGSPIAYWVQESIRDIFANSESFSDRIVARQGMATGNNDKFIRIWPEISYNGIAFEVKNKADAFSRKKRWFPYNKGGEYRRWYGNREYVICFSESDYLELKSIGNHCPSEDYYFRFSISWSRIGMGINSFRFYDQGFLFDQSGHSIFLNSLDEVSHLLLALNNKFYSRISLFINPTLNLEVGNIGQFPYPKEYCTSNKAIKLLSLSREDWNSFETSWDFLGLPLLKPGHRQSTLEGAYHKLHDHWLEMTSEMQGLEEENNRIFINAYGLQDELSPDVPLHEITLTCNPPYRYGPGKSDEEYETLQRSDTMRELIAYTIGCMMGRYSLDKPGLVYAHAGNEGFDPSRYGTFQADEDGIVPVMDGEWFDDDATTRFVDFVRIVWPAETLDENLKFVADSLDPKKGETSAETIRRFISSKFFKDHHLKVYKKRPIYWLFSSGKHKAFECLVYLHRYNENTLPRMRAAYVTPLQGKFNARIEYLKKEIDAAPSTAARKQLQKELDTMTKKQQELRTFDELLRHHADQRITLDLDDGVKVNYGKFGGLLAEVKTITGGSEE
jgi:type II restriction/modification system DNA methylase subunit YeeA